MPLDGTHNGNDAPQSALSSSLRQDGARIIERLDGDELLYFQLNKVQGLPRARCAEMLGWSKARTENVRRRLNRNLRELRRVPRTETEVRKSDLIQVRRPPHGSSLKPFYAEQLPSGRRVWSFSPTHSNLYRYPNLPICRGPLLKGEAPIMRIQQLERELASEQTKLDKLVSEAREIAAEVRTHTTELSKLKTADEDSVLQPEFPARVTALEKLLADSKVREQAFARVVARQREVVKERQDAITAHLGAAFILESKPLANEIHSLVSKLKDKMAEFQQMGFKFQQDQHAQAYALYPWDHRDPFAGGCYRDHAVRICSEALVLSLHEGTEPSVLAVQAVA